MLTVGSLFSGVGLLDYGLHLAGLHHAWLCEREADRRHILGLRWPDARVLDDVRHVGVQLPRVDVIAGGFPCKGASSAGKLEGFGHPETVLWREMARAVGELRPRYVVVENVANILALHDGAVWGEVLGTLAALGYDTVWDCIPAGAVGAPHGRDRVFAVASGTTRGTVEPGRMRRGEREADQGAAADAADDGSERRGQARGRRPGSPDGHLGTQAAPDTGERGQPEQPAEHGGQPARPDADPERRGVPVEWGIYGPAIRRWEAVVGRAPEPLVRRVDDRRTTRLERSRLAALGDGVQVQVGRIVGEYVVELERQRGGVT